MRAVERNFCDKSMLWGEEEAGHTFCSILCLEISKYVLIVDSYCNTLCHESLQVLLLKFSATFKAKGASFFLKV